ncbi:COG1470 family protein [Frigoriglobus tundricola]|uniref:Uncharacterized protein n=1 Tax=Frigoriglobus tundricola TaxID=2774151 RepID=A0A6M5YZK9_9BACT|nr:hypothetical protein [Frigoriglobus tundricola]QJW99489.1 hypothetical protein FTUN_7101 [Frigoriglobus tundricola]
MIGCDGGGKSRMDNLIARCPNCGMEQADAFAHCFVCMTPSRWWCRACCAWRPTRGCPACGGGLTVPSEVFLGGWPVGTTVPFKITARNPNNRLVGCAVSTADEGVTILAPRILVAPFGYVDVSGRITLPPGPLGRRTFRLAFPTGVTVETVLVVEAQVPTPRLEFVPAHVALRAPRPGGTVSSAIALKNTGNVALTAALSAEDLWLSADPRRLTLAPGESVDVRLRARSRKTDSGTRETLLTAVAEGGTWAATVRYALPPPELTANPVSFGELSSGGRSVAEVVVRNTGHVRVVCAVTVAAPWLSALPARINLAPGGERTVRLRALVTAEHDGPLASELILTSDGEVVLRVPVTATATRPRPQLRPVRRQRVLDAAGTAIERRFQLANDGDGRLDLTAGADQPWVKLLTPELSVAPGKKRNLRYRLDLTVLPRGEHKATITLATNAGPVEVPIAVTVLDPNPLLEILPAPAMGAVSPGLPLSAFVQVRNAGIGLLTVRAESESPWVVVSPPLVDVPAGPPVRLNLSIRVAGLGGGEHEAAVRLTSNGGSGRAAVRFRLPVEQIDVPKRIDLGDLPAGQSAGHALRVRNFGPDRVGLTVRGEHPWLEPGRDYLTVNPGETVALPFRVNLPSGVLGPVGSTLVLEGRAVRYAVAVRAWARKVELVLLPGVVSLGPVNPCEVRTFTVDVLNAGEIAADIRESHTSGPLEVWVRRATVLPGERVTLLGRVRVNERRTGASVRATVQLADGAALGVVARVVAPTLAGALAVATVAGALLAGAVLAVSVGWWAGVPALVLGICASAWIYDRQTT